MHNCKTERERIIESLLNENGGPSAQLPDCPDCRHEFSHVRETLRVTRRQLESVVPSDEYFRNYHLRLRHQLAPENRVASNTKSESSFGWLTRALTMSFRLPVPVAAVLLVAFALSLVGVYKFSQSEPLPPQLSIIRVPVEVPIIQERVVTKVVYRKQKSNNAPISRDTSNSSFAQFQREPSLVGFKPLDEVKLTVIKGGTPDEK